MSLNKYFAGFALIAAVQLGLAADTPKKVASVEGLTEYQLDNGLRVLLFPDSSQSKVTVKMTVLVGSRQEGSAGAVGFSIQAKRDTLPAVLELLRQVLRGPALPTEQFELLKRERLAAWNK